MNFLVEQWRRVHKIRKLIFVLSIGMEFRASIRFYFIMEIPAQRYVYQTDFKRNKIHKRIQFIFVIQ